MSAHRSRASVTSQIVPQPLILAARSSSSASASSMSRENSQRSSKRDSAVGLAGLVHRVPSLKHPRPPSDPTMPNTPVYRLVSRLDISLFPSVAHETWTRPGCKCTSHARSAAVGLPRGIAGSVRSLRAGRLTPIQLYPRHDGRSCIAPRKTSHARLAIDADPPRVPVRHHSVVPYRHP